MPKKKQLTQKEKDLIRRYLMWCYKTTKEELDKIERYFTQLKADGFVLQSLRKTKEYRSSDGDKGYKEMVDQFQVYMEKKEANVLKKKFTDNRRQELNPDYQYLKNRFAAIGGAIRHFLGAGELKKTSLLYEQEMTRRILQAREHT
ncbi:MAG: hypothetical protein KAS66_11580 [Candidatus Omnitrophica bacterium]|nr:hypothetical protein [Candidatus Omnitrophota bacterium]